MSLCGLGGIAVTISYDQVPTSYQTVDKPHDINLGWDWWSDATHEA